MPKRKTKQRRIFLETSGVIYEMHGHSLMQEAVRAATVDGRIEVSNFIRMEYLRGVIINLIELYFLIVESDSVSDALIDWSQKVAQDRKLKIALMTVNQWMVNQDEWQAKAKSSRRLGDLVVRLVYEFDETFSDRAKDHLNCQLGRVRFPRHAFSEAMLLSFYDRFRKIQQTVPNCSLCDFKSRQERSIYAKQIDLHSQDQRTKFAVNKGYVKQAERLEEILAEGHEVPRCRFCDSLGDTIVALQMPQKAVLVTADRAFVAFGQILKLEVRQLPSLAALKRAADEQIT